MSRPVSGWRARLGDNGAFSLSRGDDLEEKPPEELLASAPLLSCPALTPTNRRTHIQASINRYLDTIRFRRTQKTLAPSTSSHRPSFRALPRPFVRNTRTPRTAAPSRSNPTHTQFLPSRRAPGQTLAPCRCRTDRIATARQTAAPSPLTPPTPSQPGRTARTRDERESAPPPLLLSRPLAQALPREGRSARARHERPPLPVSHTLPSLSKNRINE